MRRLCSPLLVFFAPLALFAAEPLAPGNPRYTGTPFLRRWVSEDYGTVPGNQCVIQHPHNGFIYVGDNAGVLEFDGARWRLIPVPNRPIVRTLAVDGRGRVWAANDDTISCLAPDARGDLRAETAIDRLPEAERGFRGAVASLGAPDGVFVAATARLFFFGDDGATRVWSTPDEGVPLRLWWEDGAPHVQFINRKIHALRDGRMQPVTTTSPLAAALGTVRPAGDEGTVCATTLADGHLALGTALEGLVVRTRDGREVQRLDRTRGLPSNRVEGLCEDREGGVWLALRNGLARVQLDSPYALHGPAQRFDGSGRRCKPG